MRISELSRRSGVPVATIKYYLRERLLPPGRPTGRNQAQYDENHCRRLHLIRAFTTVGQLDLTSVGVLLSAIDGRLPVSGLFDVLHELLAREDPSADELDDQRCAGTDVAALVDQLGWRVERTAPGHQRLVRALAAMRRLGCDSGMKVFAPYAEAADRLARFDIEILDQEGPAVDRAATVARAILLDEALAAMRQLAKEHHVGQRADARPH